MKKLYNLTLVNTLGFIVMVTGAGILRLSNSDIMPIIGGMIIVSGVGILSLTRLIK